MNDPAKIILFPLERCRPPSDGKDAAALLTELICERLLREAERQGR